MKILRVSRNYPRSNIPGAGLPAFYLSKYIKEPHLFITKRLGGKRFLLPEHVQVVEIGYPEPQGLTERPTAIDFAGWAIGKVLGYFFFLLRSLNAVNRFRPDIVHIHTPLPMAHGIYSKMTLGSKLVLTFHGTDFVRVSSNALMRAVINRWVDCICYVAPFMYNRLKEYFPKKRIRYTPSGVDLTEFVSQDGGRKAQILAVGNLRWQKGYIYLIEAAQQLKEFSPDWKFFIIGEGKERRILEDSIDKFGLKNTVFILGTRSRSEVSRFMQESGIFVLSSVSEGFPKVLLEAMASGIPIVTADVGCCKEIVGEAGVVVPSKNSSALASALKNLITKEDLRKSLGQAGPKLAEQYSWDNVGKIVHSEYRSLLSS